MSDESDLTPEERDRRSAKAEEYSKEIARTQELRETQVGAALASSATFLTLISVSATGRVSEAHADQLHSAQLLLCFLFFGTLSYYLTSIYNYSIGIADNGARWQDITHGRSVVSGTRSWRFKSSRGPRFLATIPRFGQSQRQALLFLPVVGLVPAAWFALTRGRSGLEDGLIIAMSAVLALLVVRLFLAGCRHWLWMDPKTLVLEKSPLTDSVPIWGWWFYRHGVPAESHIREWLDRKRATWEIGDRDEP